MADDIRRLGRNTIQYFEQERRTQAIAAAYEAYARAIGCTILCQNNAIVATAEQNELLAAELARLTSLAEVV